MSDRSQGLGSSSGYHWVRRNVLGLVAIFIALNGTAVAVQVAEKSDKQKAAAAKKKKAKRGPAGPPGPAGPQGPQGPAGSGSPDTPAEVLAKLVTVDGSGSTLDADTLDGTELSSAGTINTAGNPVDWTQLKGVPAGFADGTDNDSVGGPPSGAAGAGGGALSGTYPDPTLDVSGGPCANGQALTDVSNQAALTCAPGVYTDAADFNVAAGPSALSAITDGIGNAAFGQLALASTTTGSLNSAVGTGALVANASGDSNSALGQNALLATTGSGNTALGRNAGSELTTGSNNLDLDNLGAAGESNTIRIGDTQTRSFLAGVSGVTPSGSTDPVVIDSSGQLGTDPTIGVPSAATVTDFSSPNVAGKTALLIDNTALRTIINLPGGVAGQVVTLVDVDGANNFVVPEDGPFQLNGFYFSNSLGDSITVVFTGTSPSSGCCWVEVARSDN